MLHFLTISSSLTSSSELYLLNYWKWCKIYKKKNDCRVLCCTIEKHCRNHRICCRPQNLHSMWFCSLSFIYWFWVEVLESIQMHPWYPRTCLPNAVIRRIRILFDALLGTGR
jgi:hypothetical protein